MLDIEKQRDLFARLDTGTPYWLAEFDRQVPEVIHNLVDSEAVFVINHSGGKDSQAMYHFVRRHVPDRLIRVVHAVLPEVDWDGVVEHIQETLIGHRVETCFSKRRLLEIVEARGMFPSPAQRWCTSDTKRAPIERTIRHMGHKLIVNCMGMRAQESPKRAKLDPFKRSDRNSKAGRDWYEWLPIHDWLEPQVFEQIALVKQKPHWAYAAGMSRLSCVFCIMSSKADLTTAAKLKPELYRRYVELEKKTGQVMIMPSKKKGVLQRLTLEQITGIPA